MDLKDYFLDVKGEVLGDKPTPGAFASVSRSSGNVSSGSAAAQGKGPSPVLVASSSAPSTSSVPAVSPASATPSSPAAIAKETIDAGRQYQELDVTHKSLRALLDQARIGNQKALSEIVEHYGFDPEEVQVTITKPMKDGQGQTPVKYGLRLISSEEELTAIRQDCETAAVYYPGIELHCFPTTKRNKQLAVVMGISALEFNAVIAAEKRKVKLENELRALDAHIEKGRKEMGVDKMPRVPTGADKKPAAPTPPEAKPVAKNVTLAKK